MAYPGQVIVLGWRMGNDLLNLAGRGWLVAEMSHTTVAQPPELTHVWPDDVSIGHAAATYLEDAGFRQVFYRVGNRSDNPIRQSEMKAAPSAPTIRYRCEAIDLPTNPTDDDAAEHVRYLQHHHGRRRCSAIRTKRPSGI